jgi:predicted O-methyltransferase YrrM
VSQRILPWGRRVLDDVRWTLSLGGLPPRVALFQLRARRLARRTGDTFSLTSATRPADLRTLIEVARGRRRVVELGTATAWTAISLALADPERGVLTLDVVDREEPHRYLQLIPSPVRSRVQIVIRPGADGPTMGRRVDLLYIDSSHDRDATVAEVLAWRPVMDPHGLIVFDDYTHPDFPGVRQAVVQLGLTGFAAGTLFIARVGAEQTR